MKSFLCESKCLSISVSMKKNLYKAQGDFRSHFHILLFPLLSLSFVQAFRSTLFFIFSGFFLILQHVYLLRRHLWACIHVPLVKGTYWLLFQRLLVKLPESKQCLTVIYITNSKGSDSFFWLLKVHISCTDIHSVKRPIDIKIKRRRYSYHLHLFFYKFVKHGSWSWRVNIGFKFILELLAKTLHLW